MLPAGAALDRILDASGMLALAATSPDGVEAGDLLHALDRVRAIVERGFTLADAADALAGWSGLDEDGAKESNEVDSLPLEPGRPGVVRLMNLHKAKGLEAKVVFLADPKGGFPSRVDVRIVRTPGSVAKGYFRIEKDTGKSYAGMVLAEPKGWDSFATDEQAYLDAEVHRLMYVAATRAQDLLVIGRINISGGGAGKNAAWPVFDKHLDGVPELSVPTTVTLPAAEDGDLSAKAFSLAVSAAERAHAAAQAPSWMAVSVTSEAKAFPRITPGAEPGSEMEPRDFSPGDLGNDPTRVLVDDTPSRRADAGVEWGTLVHGLLEHAMRHKTATRADLRRLAMWLTMEEPRLRAVIEQALDTVESVSRADFWPTARASAEVHAEAPFALREEHDGVQTLVTGVIDLVYREADGWRILDYKTDAEVDAMELQRRYAAQRDAYRSAWTKLTKDAVVADIRSARR
jgi:ATP-dependent helicase/nuclease subunit A